MQCNLPPRWSVWQDVKQFFKGAKTIKTTRWMYAGILIAALAAGADALGAGGKGGRDGRGGGGDLPDPNQSTKREASATRRDGSRMSEAQQQNVQKLKSDLLSIKQGSQVTTEQKQALKNDLMAMADGATKPDQALVQTLANDLSQAMSDGKMTTTENTNHLALTRLGHERSSIFQSREALFPNPESRLWKVELLVRRPRVHGE